MGDESFRDAPLSALLGKCGKPAAPFIPRRGEHFACVLNAEHDGPCCPGGKCFKHGEYVGAPGVPPQCPHWPDCIAPESAAP